MRRIEANLLARQLFDHNVAEIVLDRAEDVFQPEHIRHILESMGAELKVEGIGVNHDAGAVI